MIWAWAAMNTGDEDARLTFLNRELANRRPLLPGASSLGPTPPEVLATCREVAAALQAAGLCNLDGGVALTYWRCNCCLKKQGWSAPDARGAVVRNPTDLDNAGAR